MLYYKQSNVIDDGAMRDLPPTEPSHWLARTHADKAAKARQLTSRWGNCVATQKSITTNQQ